MAIGLMLFWFSLPSILFTKPYSYVLLDRDEKLLQARIATDGQWRFPHEGEIPEKFSKALITFEDKRFSYHPGIDPVALGRAIWSNLTNQKVVSGGSTITMQVIRLSRNKPRTIWQKCIEMILSVRLELTYSKKEILSLYASHAPFGGNVVGLDAAAWRYFGRPASQLSWGEAAGLAVLPNNPSMVRPDKNRDTLRKKRNRLLDLMQVEEIIDEQTARLAKLEPVPDKPLVLPEHAPHLLASIAEGKLTATAKTGSLISSTINGQLQQRVNQVLYRYHEQFSANGINNAAAFILEVETGNVLAYAGNVYRPDKPGYDSYVDIIPAPRSPGSTLKPLLYAAMQKDGLLLPHTLVADIPTQIAGYSPQNFDLGYDGAVPASKALSRSLNVPAVRMLQQYRIERFYEVLKKLGITTLTQPAGHYGLSLILGGGENSMWELGGVYAGLARTLQHYGRNSGKYDPDDLFMPVVLKTDHVNKHKTTDELTTENILSAASIYHTFNAMNEVMRPGEEYLWTQFSSSQKIAWKTGTSFGFRDGWAIGITPTHVVVVWVGNADGEGRPGLTGINTAAPVMFELFRLLPSPGGWFDIPYDELHEVITCAKSGYLATDLCEEVDTLQVTETGARFPPCPYHQLVHLDPTGKFRVTSECESPSRMLHTSWFVLPPAMEWYYKNHDHTYRSLPAWRNDCSSSAYQGNTMEMIYPKRSNTIYVPVELDGKTGKCIFEVAHRNKETVIYWHLDGSFIGSSREFHQMALNPSVGKHLLVLIDEHGERLEQYFEILKH
jgi:penicillin-binding protein 1C